MKEAGGGDHLEIGWETPGSTAIGIIPGSALESYAYDAEDPVGDNISSAWEIAHGLDPTDNGRLNPKNGAHGDLDGDGLDNLSKLKAATLPGTAYSATPGSWFRTSGKAKQDCVRGSLAYPTTLPAVGVYQLDLTRLPRREISLV